jgi:predicted metal-binding membrane protein
MEAAPFPGVDRARLVLLGALVGLAALAWLVVAQRMAGMDAGPGTDPGTLGFYTVSWVVMMAAMMFPSIAPMVLVFSSIQRRRRVRGGVRAGVSTNLFTAGYLVSWTVAGLGAYAAFAAVRSLSIGALKWSHGGRYVAGAVLIAAAAYQLTPAKNACLRRCRGPLDFVLEHWREGRLGALRMGAIHGAWCVGCCWMLMAALFALGLMSITWMVVVAAAIAAEKLLPAPAMTNRVIAAGLAALGLAVIASPSRVPGLVLPDSAQARHAMQAMPGMHRQSSPMPSTPGGDMHSMPGMHRQPSPMPSTQGSHRTGGAMQSVPGMPRAGEAAR